jgi:ankyrin repeat protein
LIDGSSAGHCPEPLDVDCRDHRGHTPLICCAIKGDIDFIKLIIEKAGANIDLANPKGISPLMYAGREGHPEIVRYLLKKGAVSLKQDH